MVAYQGRGRQMSVSSRTVRALLHRETLSQKEKKKKVTVSQEVRIMTSLLHRQSRTLIKKKKKKSSLAVPMAVCICGHPRQGCGPAVGTLPNQPSYFVFHPKGLSGQRL